MHLRVVDVLHVEVRVERVQLSHHRSHAALFDKELPVALNGPDAARCPFQRAV